MQHDVVLNSVNKVYGHGPFEVRALCHLNIGIPAGQFVVVLGPSGSGKTTLLNLIGGLDLPTSGLVRVAGVDLTRLSERELTYYRRTRAGFIFQFFNLVPTLTARENVLLAAQLVSKSRDVDKLLEAVGLKERAHHFPSQLSGGEQQRVAVARALVKDPKVILADEPTGSLDSETGEGVLALLHRLSRQEGRTVLLVTHDASLARTADRIIRLKDGEVIEDSLNPIMVTPEVS